MATIALVHGVCAGAWCWEPLIPMLIEAGHKPIAVDLPSQDTTATFSDYAQVVVEALAGSDDDVVLVGHSTGGLTIPLVAEQRPVRELVYVCGAIPVPGKSVADTGVEWRSVDPTEWQTYGEDGSFSISPDGFRRHVCQDVEPTLLDDAIAQLRPQSLTPFTEPCPLTSFPSVPSRYILCRDDHIVSPDWSRKASPERLGVQPIELPGSHSPMASRPGELVSVLLTSH